MITISDTRRYAFTFSVKRRKRPNDHYGGVLRTHRFFIEYHNLLGGEDLSGALENSEAEISFPIKFSDLILDFARELGGKTVEVRKVKVRGKDLYYEKPVVFLPNEVAFRRHLLFTLTVSTYRNASEARFNALRNLLLAMNANFLNILSRIAMERYDELKSSRNQMWYWYMLRVGRAVKSLYGLD